MSEQEKKKRGRPPGPLTQMQRDVTTLKEQMKEAFDRVKVLEQHVKHLNKKPEGPPRPIVHGESDFLDFVGAKKNAEG